MKTLAVAVVVGMSMFAAGVVAKDDGAHIDLAANTYEHLATAIIEIEASEDALVHTIIDGYHKAAQEHLKLAGKDTKAHVEAAAELITFIASEGNKQVQAVRQRLAAAGHTHHTDAETKEDYLFVDGKEKKALIELAKKVGALGASAKPADIDAAAKELAQQYDKAMAPEKKK